MTPGRVRERVETAGLSLIRFLYCDTAGVVRGKLSSTPTLAGRMESGIGLTVAMAAMNMLDHLQSVAELGAVGEVRLVPDPATFVVLPFAPGQASMQCDLVDLDGLPWGACPRSFLKRQVALAGQHNLVVQAAFEGEFLLARDGQDGGPPIPVDRARCFSASAMNTVTATGFLDRLVAALAIQQIPLEQYYPELGHGQQEYSISHAPALRAADEAVTVRETARGVANALGLRASFAPKPLADQAGNGAHIHFSLWNPAGDVNLFYDPDGPYRVSLLGRQFIAGILAHLPGLAALVCPTVNSYRRLQPQTWASAFACWGPDNREAAVRVASPFRYAESATSNAELKTVDGSSNPYLALGGLIAAGLDGIVRALDPGEPLLVDPSTLSDEEREQRGLTRAPTSLGAALDALQMDDVLMEALGPLLAAAFLTVKHSEVDDFAAHDDAYEFDQHVRTF